MQKLTYRSGRAQTLPNPSAAYRLFHHRHLCRVRHIHLLHQMDIEVMGLASTGDKKEDMALLQEWTPTYMPPSVMAEFHSRGINIIIDDPKRSVEIYNAIKEHLSDWDKELQHSLNKCKPPIDDLIAFDEFAEKLWQVAKYYVPKPIETNSLFAALDKLGMGNEFIQRKLKVQTQADVVDLSTLKHDPFRESLLKHDALMRK